MFGIVGGNVDEVLASYLLHLECITPNCYPSVTGFALQDGRGGKKGEAGSVEKVEGL